MGSVTKTRVSMTWREDGSVSLGARWDAAAWRAVERREMNMEPTLPGRPIGGELGKGEREIYVPLMTTARRGKPGYLEAKVSRTIPVPLLMTMAPKRGVQPCHMRSLTAQFPRTMTAHAAAEHRRRMAIKRGRTVLTQ